MFQTCGKMLLGFASNSKQKIHQIHVMAFRTGSFVPYASCHHPIRNVCNVWLVSVCGTCTQYIPYAARFSWWSLPGNFKRQKPFGLESNRLKMLVSLSSYLLSEDWFGLTTETLLFTVITTTTLCSRTFLRLLVLCHFVQFMTFAFFAKSAPLFWYVHLN